MAHRCWSPVVGLWLGLSLLAGCTSSRSGGPVPATPSPAAGQAVPEAAQRASDDSAIAHARYASALIHELNGETEAALQDYYEAALKDPGSESLILDVATRFLQEKQPDKALQLLEMAAARKNASGAVLARLGLVYSQQGKREQSLAACRAAIKRDPDLIAPYQTLFVSYIQAKQPAEGWKVLAEAFRRPRPGPEFLAALAEMYLNYAVQVADQRPEANRRALLLIERAEKLSSGNPALRLKLADGFNLLGETRRSADIYLELLKTVPEAPLIREHIHAKLADLYLRGKDPKLAAEQLQELVKAFPTNPQAYYFLGGIAYDQKQYAGAAEYFAKTVLLSPEFEQAHYDLAAAQLAARQTDAAVDTLEKARGKFHQNFTLELFSAMAYSQKKDWNKALEHFTAAEVVGKATDPKRINYAFYLQLASAYEGKGDYAEAERQAKRALELSPDAPEALNFLGYMWADRNQNLEQAREMIDKAVKAEPENAAFLDSLGWILFRQGQPRPALDYILKAIELNGQPDATLYDHLGEIQRGLGDFEKAREAWRKSLEIEPNEAIRKKLEGAGK